MGGHHHVQFLPSSSLVNLTQVSHGYRVATHILMDIHTAIHLILDIPMPAPMEQELPNIRPLSLQGNASENCVAHGY